MPNNKPRYSLTVDGKQRTVEADKFNNNIDAFVNQMPNATVRMKDKEGNEKDIKLNDLSSAYDNGYDYVMTDKPIYVNTKAPAAPSTLNGGGQRGATAQQRPTEPRVPASQHQQVSTGKPQSPAAPQQGKQEPGYFSNFWESAKRGARIFFGMDDDASKQATPKGGTAAQPRPTEPSTPSQSLRERYDAAKSQFDQKMGIEPSFTIWRPAEAAARQNGAIPSPYNGATQNGEATTSSNGEAQNMTYPLPYNGEAQNGAQTQEQAGVNSRGNGLNAEFSLQDKYGKMYAQDFDKEGEHPLTPAFMKTVQAMVANGDAPTQEDAVSYVFQKFHAPKAMQMADSVAMGVVGEMPETVKDDEVGDTLASKYYTKTVQDQLHADAAKMGFRSDNDYDQYVDEYVKPMIVRELVSKYRYPASQAQAIANALFSHEADARSKAKEYDPEALNDDERRLYSLLMSDFDKRLAEDRKTAEGKANAKAEAETASNLAIGGREGHGMQLGVPIETEREYNAYADPSKAINYVLDKLMGRNGSHGANGANGSEDVDRAAVGSLLYRKIMDKLVQERVPKSKWGYVLKGFMDGDLGELYKNYTQTDFERHLNNLADTKYLQSLNGFSGMLASGGHEATKFLSDAWEYYLGGKVGSAVTSAVRKRAIKRFAGDLVERGIQRNVAEDIATRAFQRTAQNAGRKAVMGAMHGAGTMGTAQAISGSLRQAISPAAGQKMDEILQRKAQGEQISKQQEEQEIAQANKDAHSITSVLGAGAKGGLSGIAAGMSFGPGTFAGETVSKWASKYMGDLASAATGYMARLGTNAASSTALGQAEGAITGEKPEGNIANQFAQNLVNFAMLDAQGAAPRLLNGHPIKTFREWKEYERSYGISDADQQRMRDAGYGDMIDTIDGLVSERFRDRGTNTLPNNGWKPQEEATRINDGMMKMFADNTIPEELKRKYYSLVTGDNSKQLSPVVASEVTKDEDGNHYLVTYNKNGNVVSDRQYHSEKAAQDAQKKIGHEQDENLTDALQQGVFAKDADALMEQAYNAAVDAFKNGDGSLSQDQQSLLYLYQNKDRLGNAIGAMNTGEPLSEADQRLVNLYYTMQNKLFEHDANSHEGNIYNIARDAETANGIQAHGLYVARKGHTEKEAKKLAEQNGEVAVHVGGDVWRTSSEDAAVKDYQQRLYDYMSGIEEGQGAEVKEPGRIEDKTGEDAAAQHRPTEPSTPQDGTAAEQPAERDGSAPYKGAAQNGSGPEQGQGPALPPEALEVRQQQQGQGQQQESQEQGQQQPQGLAEGAGQEKTPLQQRREAGYERGMGVESDETQLAQIQHDADLANQRFNAAFADGKMNNFRNAIIDAVKNDDEDAMTELLNKYDGQLSEEQKEATYGLIESGAVQNGIDDSITSQTMEYQEQRQKELADISDPQGNITALTLTDGTTAYLKNGDLTNQYGGVMVVDENGETKQIPVSSIAKAEEPVSAQQQLDNDTNSFADDLRDTYERLRSGADILPGQQTYIKISGQTIHVTCDRKLEDGTYQLHADDGSPFVLSPDEMQQRVKAARDESVATELTNQQQQRAAQELEERRAKGIAGYAEGKPDLGAVATDPTVAGEYLRQQQAEGGNDPLPSIEGNIEEQKRLQQQAQSDLDRHQQWMDINGDQYSPEDKATKEAIIEQRKKEIADTQQRIRKLGQVRNAYMSPEQRMKLRSDRMRNSDKVRKAALANRQKALEGTEPTQTTVDGIDNKTLLDNYPTQLDAENYLQARRDQITTAYRDGAARTIANVQRRLQDYYNGLEELTDDDLMQLHTDLAGAQEAERVAMERIKEIKAQQQKLGTLYKERNKAELDKMDPADRRAEILKGTRTPEELLKKAHEAYKGSALEGRLDDLEPETLEEYVSQNLGYGSLNWEGTGTGISQKKGLKQELGLKRGIGHGFDSNGINAYLAPTGKGMSVDMAAHKMWEGSRGTQFDSYDDQDFKNAILDMLGSAQKATDIKYLTIRNRINEVEDYERGIEEQERWYKEQQDEELKKRQQDIDTYNDNLSSIAESSTLTPDQENYFNGLYADEIAEVEQEEADRQAAWEAYEAEKEEQLKQNNDGSNRQGEVNSGAGMDKKPEPGTDDAGNGQGEEAVPGAPAHQPTAETEHHAQRQVGDRPAHTPSGNSDADGGVPVQAQKLNEIKVRVSHFPTETSEESGAFGRLVPKMTDEELLAYMRLDGNGDPDKAYHPELYDEYDYRHGDEEQGAYDSYLQQLKESGTTKEQAEDMLANVQSDYAINGSTDKRPMLNGQQDALIDYIQELEGRENLEQDSYDSSHSEEKAAAQQRPTEPSTIKHETTGTDTAVADSKRKQFDLFVRFDLERFIGKPKDKRVAIDWEHSEPENDYIPMKIDGVPSFVGVTEQDGEDVTDDAPTYESDRPVAIYDIAEGGDFPDASKTAEFETYAKDYNSENNLNEDSDDYATMDDRYPYVAFKNVDAAVKFNDWLNGRKKRNINKPKSGNGSTAVAQQQPTQQPTEKPAQEQYKPTVKLTRAGDFYEAHGDGADIAGKVLGITVTKRNDSVAKMAGFPKHALDTYLPKLIKEGYPVDIIEGGKVVEHVTPQGSIGATSTPEQMDVERQAVNTEPTDGQKEAGNYKKGHVKVDGYDITIENPKGSTRSGKDANGKEWSIKMNYDYGYILGTKGTDGDHIDVYLSDNPTSGNVYVVDQIDQETGKFDEHKVMYGFPSMEAARDAYKSQYEDGWKVGTITEVSRPDFKKWVESSTRKMKPFSEYKSMESATMSQLTQHEGDGNNKKDISAVVNDLKQGNFDSLGSYLGDEDMGNAYRLDMDEAHDDYESQLGTTKGLTEEAVKGQISLLNKIVNQASDKVSKAEGDDLYDRLDDLARALGNRKAAQEYYDSHYSNDSRNSNPLVQAAQETGHLIIGGVPKHEEQKPTQAADPKPLKTGDDVLAEVERRKKKKEPSAGQQLDLFGNFAEGDKTESKPTAGRKKTPAEDNNNQLKDKDNDLRGTDELRTEGLQADDHHEGEHTPRQSETTAQGREAADRKGEAASVRRVRSSDDERLRPGNELEPEETPDEETEEEPEAAPEHPLNRRNNHADRGVDYAPKGVDDRIEANIKAIELSQQITEEGRAATPDEMKVLRKYSGWGGLGKAFKEKQHPWETDGIAEQLKSLLGDEGYEQAVMSRNSAYFTPANVIDTMWDIARALGFKGGNVLEGSAGIGNIIGLMPQDMSDRSHIQAVEIDSTSGNILSLLYPEAKTDIQGFEKTKIRNGSVDLAITNVPFVTGLHVNDTTGDGDLSRKFGDIHDFCIAKNIRKLRPGGIGIFITSNGTLDKSQKLRDWIVSDGDSDVVGAFRMNNSTFGGTSATSDIIVVRRRVNGEKVPNAIDVSNIGVERVAKVKAMDRRGNYEEKPYSIDYNQYFIDHPENMGGKMYLAGEKGDTYRPTSKGLFPVPGISQTERMKEWVKKLADSAKEWKKARPARKTQGKTEEEQKVYEALGDDVHEGSMLVDSKGNLCVATYGEAVPIKVNKNKVKGHTKIECFNAYSRIKDAVKAVLDYQTKHEDNEGLEPLIKKLNQAYDSFVATYGHLNKNVAIAFLKRDMDYSSIAALETFKDSNDKNGKRVTTYGKTDIFKQRVIEKETEPKPTNIKDGVITSIYQYGKLDLNYIAEQLGKTPDEVKKEIISSGLGFEDPVTRETQVSYEYLSGNVREKLHQAEEANEDGQYNNNIQALKKVIPMDIPSHLIDFTLGSSWLDSTLYDEYIKDRTGIDVTTSNVNGTWAANVPKYGLNTEKNRTFGVHSSMFNTDVYGTDLIIAAMKNKTIGVSRVEKHADGKSETVTDKDATTMCAQRIEEIRDDFKDWARGKMQNDPDLAKKCEDRYNEQFNNYVPREIPDNFLPEYFAGANHAIHLRAHQAKAAIRATMQNVLFAHEVGSGKTFTLITTAMEMRRLGTAKKPLIVVQNATVGQFVASAKFLYPNAKILTIDDKEHDEQGRRAFYAKVKYNDWDMIVIPQSVLEKIPDSDERQLKFIQDKVAEKEAVLAQMQNSDMDDPFVTRRAEKELADLQDQMQEITQHMNEHKKERDSKKAAVARQNAAVKAQEMLNRKVDDVENFDDMGIDAFLVDEAHEYKHLGFATAMQRGVKGIDPSYSKKCAGVYLKCQSVMEKSGGKNVVFATGTPISNTAAEIWTFMKYLMPEDRMKSYGIYYFDDFVRNFGTLSQMPEFNTSGQFVEVNRFRGYSNLPELVRIWSGVADTVLSSEVGDLSAKIPKMKSGKAIDVYLPQSRSLRAVMKYVREQLKKFNEMSGKEKRANSAIPLKMYNIAKQAAVDPRLVSSNSPDEPNSKTNAAVKETLKSLDESKAYRGTIAIFADNYQNSDGKFNLFDDIKKKLVAKGVPDNEIVIIRPSMKVNKKTEIFDKLNAGEVRVVMGTTFTLGTGANFQERLYTLINIDAPNRPMDYTQRLGRILRQGNLHREWGIPVKVIRFGVEDSLDVTAYQRLKTKGAIADSIMHGKQLMKNSMENRTIEEEEDQFGDTVAQLSGSQYAMLKQGAEREVKKWENKKKQWEADQVYIHAAKPRLKGQIEEAQKRADYNAKGLQYLEEHKGDGTIVAGKQRFKNVEAMGDFIKNFNKTVKANEDEMRKSRDQSPRAISVNVSIDGVNFKITMKLDRDMMSNGRTLFEKISRDMRYYCPQLTGDWGVPVKGDLLRNALEDITQNVMTGNDLRERKKSAENEVTRLKGELEQVVSREGKPFQYGDKLADAQKKLADFTEKMKVELEEKQKKYAAIDAEVEEVTPDDVNTDGGETEQSEDGDKGTLYRMADDDEAAMLDKEPTVKVYRAMQLIDGKLYPPMMAAVKGKLVEPRELGQWEVADERPDIITHTKMNKKGEEIGYVKLDKGSKTSLGKRGTPIPAAYNPYWHTSRSPLNDQFKSAWIRPNIVTVEVEIPESELTSGYRAKYAKDPVGETDWLSGVVTKQLTAQGHAPRKVILSRYDKPVRVLSAAETAERIIDYIGDYDVTIPENVVTPQVRVELEKRGIKIGESEKGVKKTEQIREAIERGLSVSDDMLRDSEVFEDGEKMPIYVREGNYGVEGLNNDYRTISDLLDAFRDKYPSYVATVVDNSGKEIDPYGDNRYILDHWIDGINIQVEPWKKYLKGGEAVVKQQPTQQGSDKKAYIARKTRNAQTAVKHWADKLHLGDKVIVLTSTDGLQGNKARAKGWYVPKDDKITIVLPNHTNVGDVIRTLLHEGVAHYGLRKLFGKHFDTFLDNVYNNANYDVKSRIRRLEEKYNGDKRKATEEYLAGLAEDTDFEHTVNSSWWGRIKNLFLDMLAKVGLKLRHALTDSDLRYVLWRSYENMKNPGEKRTPGDGHLDDPIEEIEGEKEPEKAVEKPKTVRHEPVVPKPRVAAEKQDIASKIKEIKAAHGNPLVLINGGGYLSAYGKDAESVAKLFGTELIRQGGKKDGLALTSIMSDDLDSVLPRLIRAGHRVAVADERDIFAGEPGNDEAIVFDKDDIYSGDSMNRRGAATREHTEQEKEDMRNAAEELGETLGGVTVTMEHNGKDGIKGSYNTGDNTVHVNLDEADGIEDIEATVAHEVLGHEGLKALFGSNKGVDKFGQFIYDSASKKLRRAIVEKAAEEGYEWTDPQRFTKAAQEVFADIASDGPSNADEFSLWRKVKHYVIRALKALGIRIRGLVNDHDLRYYVLKTGKAVKKWRTMGEEAQREAAEPGRVMYSRRGKPRKRKDETMAQYIERLRTYEQWKHAEEKAKAANDPLPEKEDYDQKAQDEYNKAMDDWRKANNIQPGDKEPSEFPKRKDGESPQDYAIRVADYETQSDIWKNAPNVFDYMKKAQDEYRAAYEAWKTRYDIHEMESVEEKLYSGEPISGTQPQTDEQHYDQLEVEHAVKRDAERELGDAVGMDLSADGARHHAKLAVIERRKNLESASAEDAIFIHDLCKDIDALAKKKGMKPAELREKLIDVIESPVAQQESEKEVDKWVEVLNNMRAFQDAHAAITSDGVEAAMPELNALSHLYVKYGVKPSTYEQRKEIHDAAKALADKFNDYYKDTTGYNQLFGDDIMQVGKYIVKMSDAAYAAAAASKLAEDPDVKAIVDRIHDWYDNFFHAIEDAGLRGDAGYVENGYINHIWDKEKSDPSAWEKYVENFQRTKSANMRHRTISTYADGIEVGLVPKFNDVAKIMSYYSRQNNEAIANKKFLDDLSFLTVDELNGDGEVTRTLPVLNSHHPSRFDEERYQMYHVPGVGDVWVLKEVARRFASIFGTMRTQDIPDWLSKTGKVYDLLGSTMKKIQLSISGFHALALTEVAIAQMGPINGVRWAVKSLPIELKPLLMLKELFKGTLIDSIKNGTIPAYARPEDFKFAASHLVQLGATQDYAAADVNMITEKFRNYVKGLREDDAFIKQATGTTLTPLAVMLDFINKGMDKLLWNYLHDGLKIACFKWIAERVDKMVEKRGLTAEQRERLLDEAGQYVNDTFGGQYWELLNVSPAALKWMRRALLSPDWFISTQRHFFANFGYGSLYDTRSFGEYVKESLRLKRAASQQLLIEQNGSASNKGATQDEATAQQPPTEPSEAVDDNGDIYRILRSTLARLCYVVGVGVFYTSLMNGLNAVMKARDEEKEKEKADEIRKTNPDYKSPYELAYPDGMKWYDYTMFGNSLGQQTHLFLGRYADGSEMYVRWGKQFREFPEMFIGRKGLDFPAPMIQRMMGKANPVIGLIRDNLGALGIWGFENSSDIEEIQAKYGTQIGLLAMNARHFIPFSLPTQAEKEFKMMDLFMPSQKGFTRYKAVDYFKDFIKSGDIEGCGRVYRAATMNGIDAEACLQAAITTLKAEQRDELSDGIKDLSQAVKRYDEAKTLKEKKMLKNKLTKYLAAESYKAFTRDEAMQMIEDYMNGDNVAEKDNDRYIELSNSGDIREDYRLSAISKQAKKYVTQIKTAQTNGDAATAEKLANRYGAWIEINGIINQERSAVNKLKKELGKGNDKAVMREIREIRKQAQQLVDDVPAPK